MYVLVQYCCLYWFVNQVPVYFLFGDMHIRAPFTAVYAYVVVVVVVVFTLKTVLTSIQYPSLSYSSRQRNEFPWSQANPK